MYSRHLKDFGKLMANPLEGIFPAMTDTRNYKIIIVGSEDTPYEDGLFQVDVQIPDEYPLEPPIIKFVTKIYHPNISNDGTICCGFLTHWTPSMTLEFVALSLQSLLHEPDLTEPINPVVVECWKSNLLEAKRIAREWTSKYAV